ncbi:MAG: P-II family nitrogen regulator [Candidatus Manganitrophaceae bacterium]
MAAEPKKMKRVEIIIEAVKLKKVLSIIDEAGAGGYTILPTVTGRGHRGRRAGVTLTNVFDNAMVFTLADEATAERISQEVKKLIQNYAGVIIITDADVIWPDYLQDRPNKIK